MNFYIRSILCQLKYCHNLWTCPRKKKKKKNLWTCHLTRLHDAYIVQSDTSKSCGIGQTVTRPNVISVWMIFSVPFRGIPTATE
jgi:hypothetical protein